MDEPQRKKEKEKIDESGRGIIQFDRSVGIVVDVNLEIPA